MTKTLSASDRRIARLLNLRNAEVLRLRREGRHVEAAKLASKEIR